jgi:AcrR family transcriptional regulator
MVRKRGDNKKRELLEAAVKLVAQGGIEAATVRAIAREVGVTEGAIYRHYPSKEELYWQAYRRIIEVMIHEKEELIARGLPIRQTLREWVRLSYAHYDAHPDAFTYVLLTPPMIPAAELEITTHQGRLFMETIKQTQKEGRVRSISPELALSLFTGLMLNVPRLINEGTLPGPASQYADEVADAVWRVLQPTRTAGQG